MVTHPCPAAYNFEQSAPTDPFYLGKARIRDAQWFPDLYHECGFSRGVHIRRIHYRLVSQESPIPMPDGTDYENTRKCSERLGSAARDARYAELVDIDDFIDRKNPEPMLFLADPASAPFNRSRRA
jgi:hypothetical protein